MHLWDLDFKIVAMLSILMWHFKITSSNYFYCILLLYTVCVPRHLRRGKDQEKLAAEPVPHVDYSLKQGQKISLKIGNKLKLHGDDDDDVKQAQRPTPIGKCLHRMSILMNSIFVWWSRAVLNRRSSPSSSFHWTACGCCYFIFLHQANHL